MELGAHLGFNGCMTKTSTALALLAFAALAACASTQPYGPANKSGAAGYQSLQIENNRHRVSYTDADPALARDRALLRAAEITMETGNEWFEITNEYTDGAASGRGGVRPSVSVGGSAGSGGYSGLGVGIGLGFPMGGSSGKVTTNLEIVTGKGPNPDSPNAYDARSVDINLRGRAA